MKRTKIVCTIGPASESRSNIEKMIAAGLNVARLNFSHGKYSHHAMLIRNIRTAAKVQNQPVAILQDLQGPRIRTGDIKGEGIKVSAGQKVVLTAHGHGGLSKNKITTVPIQYANLYKDLKPGATILIDDAKIELRVTAIKNKLIECTVTVGDVITSHRGMNFPGSSITAPALTTKDIADLKFGLKHGVDFVALSFVKNAADIVKLRNMIAMHEHHRDRLSTTTKIIAKIERPEAVKNFASILKVVDGIMVARGDLGLELPIEQLPLIQKKIIRACVAAGKPVIVATQMLDSMMRYPVPTRAEVSDVANAILDGTDAIMLSGETATGKYPLKAVQVMSNIAHQVEKNEIAEYKKIQDSLKKLDGVTETVSHAVHDMANTMNAKLIVCPTASGVTARSIAQYRPGVPIVALAASMTVRNQLCLTWGVTSYYAPFADNFNTLIVGIRKFLLTKKMVKKGDRVIITAGHPLGRPGQTNLIKVEIV